MGSEVASKIKAEVAQEEACTNVDTMESSHRLDSGGASPEIARAGKEARALLTQWEQQANGHGGAPCSVHASVDFFLPFLEANDCYQSPHVALWQNSGVANGILIGRIAVARPSRAIGPLRIPMPRLVTLEIVHGGLEASNEDIALQQLKYVRTLLATGEVDCVSIHHLPIESTVGTSFVGEFQGPGYGSPVFSSHWFSELADAHGAPVISNSSKTRSSFRRKDRKLEKFFHGQMQVQELCAKDEVTAFIVAAAAISERSYQGGLGVGVRNDTRWRTMLGILADSGNFRGYLLKAGDVAVAYGVGGIHRDTFCYMAGSFLPEYRDIAPGGYLLRRIFERLPEQGVRWFDFGFGDAAYKALHGNLHREEATLHLYGRSRAAKIAHTLDKLVQGTNRGTRQLLASTGMLDRARRLWRRRLER